jgi:hypothetical protein
MEDQRIAAITLCHPRSNLKAEAMIFPCRLLGKGSVRLFPDPMKLIIYSFPIASTAFRLNIHTNDTPSRYIYGVRNHSVSARGTDGLQQKVRKGALAKRPNGVTTKVTGDDNYVRAKTPNSPFKPRADSVNIPDLFEDLP